MKVNDLGEFGVIKHLTEIMTSNRLGHKKAGAHGFELVVDAGDDTAAWRCGQGTELYTTDTAVAGVHFTRATTSWFDLGWKIMAANMSDVAAMGGQPLYATVTLGLPPDIEIEELESLYKGMLALGNKHGAAIVGGDVVRSPVVFVTVGLTGVSEGEPMLRSTAREGDLVAVTGYLGSSAGGLRVMEMDTSVEGKAADYLKGAHTCPEPCVQQGQSLSENGIATAIDVSDGLVDDLSKLCEASGVAARLEADKIPVHPMLKETFPEGYMDMALGGGEDYQILFTAPEELMQRVLATVLPQASVIGQIVHGPAGEVEVMDPETGEKLSVPHGGWDHFKLAMSRAEGWASFGLGQRTASTTRLVSHSPEETREIGRLLGKGAQAGDVFLLTGPLGAGKTCLTQGIAWGLGVEGYVRSPTFVLATRYEGRLTLHHLDLFRMGDSEEALDIGIDEYLSSGDVCVVEWADRAAQVFPPESLWVELEYGATEAERIVTVRSTSTEHERVLEGLKHHAET